VKLDNGTDGQTDGQTDRQTDGQTDRQTDRKSATQYAAPSEGGGPHNNANLHTQSIVTQNTVTRTNIRGNTPIEGRPRSVFLPARYCLLPQNRQFCATHMCTGFALESLLLRVGQYFHRDVRDSGR